MNPKTNHLIRISGSDEKVIGNALNGFIRVPQIYEAEANELLGDSEARLIPFSSKSKLNVWAEKIRQKIIKNEKSTKEQS